MTVYIVSLHLQLSASPKETQVVNFSDFYSALPIWAQNGDFGCPCKLLPAGKIISAFLQGQEVKLNVAALGVGGSLGLFSRFG